MVEQDAVLVGPIYRFGLPCGIRRRFEKLEGFPGGLLPIGDVICRFKPAFGQGRVLLRKRWRSSSAGSQRKLQILIRSMGLRWHSSRRFRKCSPHPGRCAENDFVYERTRGQCPNDFQQRLKFGFTLQRVAAEDTAVHRIMARDPPVLCAIRKSSAGSPP
jgi:hypothetical protein